MGAAFPFQNKRDQRQNYDATIDPIYTIIASYSTYILLYLHLISTQLTLSAKHTSDVKL